MSLKINAQAVLVNDSISIIVNNLNPAQTLQKISPLKLLFNKENKRRINFGLTGSEYHYILIKVNARQTLYNQYLTIDNTSLDTIRISKLLENGKNSLLYLGGQLVPFNRSINYVWHTIPLEININPSYYLIAIKASQKNINIYYEIISRELLFQKYLEYERIIYFYIGIAFMISAIILLAFFLFKKPVFAAYFAYMICISVWIMSHYGKIFPYLYPQMPMINKVIKPLSSLCAGLFLLIVLQLIFVRKFQNDKPVLKIITKTKIILLITIASLFFLLSPGVGSSFRVLLFTIWHIELLFLMSLIIFIPFHYFKINFTAKIFSLASLVICLMTLCQLFANAGIIENYFLNQHGVTLGSLLENSIMAFGLFYGLLEERKIKELQLLSLESQQTDTLKKLISVQDNERKRIAGDLHDNIGPLLAALKINFRRLVSVKEEDKQLELIQKTEDIIDDSIVEIRNVAHNLMPKNLSSRGLLKILSDYFEDMEQLYNKKIFFDHNVQSIFEPGLQMNIYRIISELVLNAAKHSNAEIIKVSIRSSFEKLSVSIIDNGRGFELKHNGNKTSLGIQSAESRVQYLRGDFKLQSTSGKGTKIEIEIPL